MFLWAPAICDIVQSQIRIRVESLSKTSMYQLIVELARAFFERTGLYSMNILSPFGSIYFILNNKVGSSYLKFHFVLIEIFCKGS